jgi:hypothetical protein
VVKINMKKSMEEGPMMVVPSCLRLG